MKRKGIVTAFIFLISLQFYAQEKTVADSVTVFVFLSETCPICQSNTLTLKELYKKYKNQPIKFIGLFPNYYVTEQDIGDFKKKYDVPFDLLKDKDGAFSVRFNAIITPQVFVQNSKQTIIYSGRIDNSFYAIGKRRNITSSKDLDKALTEYFTGQPVQTPTTQAVGCLISIKK